MVVAPTLLLCYQAVRRSTRATTPPRQQPISGASPESESVILARTSLGRPHPPRHPHLPPPLRLHLDLHLLPLLPLHLHPRFHPAQLPRAFSTTFQPGSRLERESTFLRRFHHSGNGLEESDHPCGRTFADSVWRRRGAEQSTARAAHSNSTIATNDDWQTTQMGGIITADQSAEIQSSGFAPSDPAESAMIATLPPGG